MEFQLEFLLDNRLVGLHWFFILVGHSSCNLHEGTLVGFIFIHSGGGACRPRMKKNKANEAAEAAA